MRVIDRVLKYLYEEVLGRIFVWIELDDVLCLRGVRSMLLWFIDG